VKPLRRRLLAFLGAIPILLGLLVPAAAMPCAGGDGAPMSCDACLVGILPGAVACASLSQAVPAPEPIGARSPRTDVQAWFADLVIRPYGFHPVPEAPPPR
jgi:hypothetical protein